MLKWARERPCGSANKAGLTVTDRMISMTPTINGTVGVSALAQHVGNVVFTLNSRASLHTLRLLPTRASNTHVYRPLNCHGMQSDSTLGDGRRVMHT